MPFPFLPGGVLLAASVLIGALAGFGLILRAMDRAIVGVRDNLLSGLVSGIRTWGTAESMLNGTRHEENRHSIQHGPVNGTLR